MSLSYLKSSYHPLSKVELIKGKLFESLLKEICLKFCQYLFESLVNYLGREWKAFLCKFAIKEY